MLWKASLPVEGITCGSCANSIRNALKKDWILKVSVNLATSIVEVQFLDKEKASQIVTAIEDAGFDAHLGEIQPCEPGFSSGQSKRTIEIDIDGFYCIHCPDNVTKIVSSLDPAVEVIKRPTMEQPFVKIAYTPKAPDFTIRQILGAIESSDPAFKASIHRQPSPYELSKAIAARHQTLVIWKAALSCIAAVPSGVIGILYMSLLPRDTPGHDFLMAPRVSGISYAQFILFALSTPVYFLATDEFHKKAIKEVVSLWNSKTPLMIRLFSFGSMNMLISLGTTVAYVSSVGQLLAAAVYKPEEIDDHNFYFDSVVFLTLFLLLGRLIEAFSKAKTGDAVEKLGRLRPREATLVVRGSHDEIIHTDLLDVGDSVRIPAGGSPPCDGVVTLGETKFDESSLTGESRRVEKAVDDEIYAGTVNTDAPVVARVTGIMGQSRLDQIVAIVQEGQTKKAPIEKFGDAVTRFFVPFIAYLALITFLIWSILLLKGDIPMDWLAGSSPIAFALEFAITLLVASCPCGIGLAGPTAAYIGGEIAANHGILVKGGGEAFETAKRVDCVVFDKTGTLTEGGDPSVTDFVLQPDEEGVADDQESEGFLAVIRAVAENSHHPIAKAIVTLCNSKTDRRAEVTDVQEIPGKGLKATHGMASPEGGYDVLIGNEALMRDHAISISPKINSLLHDWKTEAKSIALVATRHLEDQHKIVFALSISDPIRQEASPVLDALRGEGIDVWMLSGDNRTTALATALRIGIPESNVIAEVLPEEKSSKIEWLQKTQKARGSDRRATVAMVGDGINDAPALTVADLGIAIGSGSDIAVSTADVILQRSDLRGISTFIRLSRTVVNRIKWNYWWACIYNVVVIPLAAGVFFPIQTRHNGGHVRLEPVWASVTMALSSISVVLSSLALKSGIPWLGFRE